MPKETELQDLCQVRQWHEARGTEARRTGHTARGKEARQTETRRTQ